MFNSQRPMLNFSHCTLVFFTIMLHILWLCIYISVSGFTFANMLVFKCSTAETFNLASNLHAYYIVKFLWCSDLKISRWIMHIVRSVARKSPSWLVSR